jgi:hypothetical protein
LIEDRGIRDEALDLVDVLLGEQRELGHAGDYPGRMA